MKKIFLIALITTIMLLSCQIPIDEVTYSMDGVIQKGPFQLNSGVMVQEVDKNLDPTGRMYSTTTKDDFGSFSLASKFSSQYVEVTGEGYYFNECDNGTASAKLTLKSFGDLSLGKPLNLNVLTTLVHGRIKTLVDDGEEFANARDQAESELLNLLGFSAIPGLHFYDFSLASGGDDAALLLAVSATLQKGRSVASLSQFIADITFDFSDDGTVSNTSLISDIRTGATALAVSTIVNNLKIYFSNRGRNVDVPDFSSYRNILMTAGGVIAKPVFSLSSGTFIEEKTITITGPAGAEIRYTLDGTAPTISSTLYTVPITFSVGSTTTLKAVSILNGVISEISTAVYIIKDGILANDYWVSNPGYCITYNSVLSTPPTSVTDFAMVFQKSNSPNRWNTAWNSTSKSYSGMNYLYGPNTSSTIGFNGGYNDTPAALFLYYAYLPSTTIFNQEYARSHWDGSIWPYIVTRIGNWETYNDVIRVDFDTSGVIGSDFFLTNGIMQGTGYVLFARGIGPVYIELNHTSGSLAGKKTYVKAKWYGAVPLVTFTGYVTLDNSGTPALGATIAPTCLDTTVLPSDGFVTLTVDNSFSIKQYAKAGYYTQLFAYKGIKGAYEYQFKKRILIDNAMEYNCGDLRVP